WAKAAGHWDPLNDEQMRRVFAIRLADLRDGEKQVLRAIAVLGRYARPRLVSALCRQELGEVAINSEELYRRSVLIDDGDCTAYSNDLIREYVVSNMSRMQSASLHLRAGQILATESGIPAGVLATHFYLGDDWSRCYGYAMEAATSAHTSGANTEAAHFAEVASRAAPGIDEHIAAVRTRGDALFAIGELTAAAECFARILAADLPAPPEEHAITLLSYCATQIEKSDWTAATKALRDAGTQIATIAKPNISMRLRAEHAALSLKLSLRTGDQDSTRELSRHLYNLAADLRALPEPEPETGLAIESVAAVHKTLTHSSHDALGHLSRAGRYARLVSPRKEMRYLALRGLVHTRLTEWESAEADFIRAQQIANRVGDNVAMIRLWNNLACISLGCGDWEEAGARLGQAKSVQETTSYARDLSIPIALNMANLAFYQGQLADAAARYASTEDLCVDQGSLEYVAELISCQGLVALQRGDPASAEALWLRLKGLQGQTVPLGSQEMFKVAWFRAVMTNAGAEGDVLLEAALGEQPKDMSGYLKLLMLDSILGNRGAESFAERKSLLNQAQMGWFAHFARRWFRMSATGSSALASHR
ncbi:MAG: hypothetical protein R3268_06450, partial [Acidiferrobacterales bacterium]|nr:hypothetical protein [Acidiferrobacterales bacterium]